MKKILVPTDFSASANNAINFAVQSAKTLPLDIIIVHFFEESDSLYTDYMGVNKEYKSSLKQDLHNKLDQLRLSILEGEGIAVKTKLVTGAVVPAIDREAGLEHADLIVMGTFGTNGIMKKLWGSNTAAVISHSHLPVLVIPYDYVWKKPEKFLLATNHFEETPSLLDFLFELTGLYMADVKVAVFTDEEEDTAFTMVEHSYEAARYERILKERYQEPHLEAIQLYGTDFEDTLQHYIDRHSVDILTMVRYPRNFLERIFHPSMTKRMSYHTRIPLLVLPAPVNA